MVDIYADGGQGLCRLTAEFGIDLGKIVAPKPFQRVSYYERARQLIKDYMPDPFIFYLRSRYSLL